MRDPLEMAKPLGNTGELKVTLAVLPACYVFSEPFGETSGGSFLGGAFAGCHRLQLLSHLHRVSGEKVAVGPQEDVGGNKCRSLVAIRKRLGLRDADREKGTLLDEVGVRVVRSHLGTHHCRFQQRAIPERRGRVPGLLHNEDVKGLYVKGGQMNDV